jgi:alkylation response protein AidB-like acyl-CoA dehydrogenase
MALFRKLATLAAAAEAARRYAKKNPGKASEYVDQAAQFVDKQTKGKYSGQISGVASKAKGVVGIKPTPGHGATGNGYTPGTTDLGTAPEYGEPKPTTQA